MTTLINVERVITFFGFLMIVLTYGTISPNWRKTAIGRMVMTIAGSAAALLGLGMLQLIFGPTYWGQDVLRALFFLGLGGGAWWQWYLIVKAQRDRRPPSAPEGGAQ